MYHFIIKPVFGYDRIYYSICYYVKDVNHLICVAVFGTYALAYENIKHYTCYTNTYFDLDTTLRYCDPDDDE